MTAEHRNDINQSYRQAGVDYSKIDPFKILAQRTALETADYARQFSDVQEVTASRGETAYVMELSDIYLAHVEETLGTKNLVADIMEQLTGNCYYRAMAIDTIATIVNDLIACGAFPLSIAMHLAVGASSWFENLRRLEELITGWRDACKLARCSWGGGETPTLKDMVNPDTVVMNGSAIGLIRPKSRRIKGDIEQGDAIVLLGSSGIHANGVTLARKIATQLQNGYLTQLEDGLTYGQSLLIPSLIYVPVVEDLLIQNVPIHYAIPITGHGWRKLMRANAPFTYIIEQIPEPQPIFTFIQQQASMNNLEAYATFNMGAGFALILPAEHVPAALAVAQQHDIKAWNAGYVEQHKKGRRVVILPKHLEYNEETLTLR